MGDIFTLTYMYTVLSLEGEFNLKKHLATEIV